VSDSIYVMGGESGISESDMVEFAFQFSDSKWKLFSDKELKGVDKINLLSIGPRVYVFTYEKQLPQTNLWAYKALFYEIFIPVVN